MKKRVFSGTRATGRLHLGNYLGAVKGYIELQNNPELECIYMAVDVHTITTPFDHATLQAATKDIIIDYLAAGLDPEKAIITKQSLVPEHTELAFLFSSVLTVGRMQDLPTFKDKVRQHPQNVTMALLNYPVLMAADILAYKAGLVPCGVDQEPHLEVTRDVAKKMNELYGLDFPMTQRFVTPGSYVPSLLGEGKMSKSVEGSSIGLTEDLGMIKKRLSGAPTDSGKGVIRDYAELDNMASDDKEIVRVSPRFRKLYFDKGDYQQKSYGVRNLMEFVELFEGAEKRKFYEEQYMGAGIRYGDLKSELAVAIDKELTPIRERRAELETKPEYVEKIIREGAERAREIAGQVVLEVKQKMGLG